MILDIYRDCFSRIYIFSPSIHVDYTWGPVTDYIEKDMKVKHTEEEPTYFGDYDPDELEKIINTQHKIITYMKNKAERNYTNSSLSLMISQMTSSSQNVPNF